MVTQQTSTRSVSHIFNSALELFTAKLFILRLDRAKMLVTRYAMTADQRAEKRVDSYAEF